MLDITIPYKFEPRGYQLNILRALDSKVKRAVIVWHRQRRSGKDKVCWNYIIKRAFIEKGNYYYFFPTGEQARQALWENIDNEGFKMLDHIPDQLVKRKLDNQMFVELSNGSTIKLVGSDKFEKRNVGTNPIGVVFSEFSITEPQVWEFVRPILKVNGGWAVFNFTPRGKNHAWKTLQIAKQNGWYNEILTVEDTDVLTREDIEQEKREGMPQDLADQEYYCKFIDGASSVFKRIDENIHHEKINLQYGKRYQMGVDLAKHQDYTVISIVDLHTFHLIKQIKLDHIDWSEQKEIIVKEAKYWNKARAFIDSTGVGDPIVEDLKKLISVEPFHFNETSRKQLLNNLQILFEQDKIKIPEDQELIDELKSMQYELVGQKVKMKVPEGLHDDRIMSLALAYWGLSERIPYRELTEAMREQREFRKQRKPEGINLRMTNY